MMTRTHVLRCSWSTLIVALGTSLSLAGQTAQVHSFQAPDGETYYAVALAGEALVAPAADRVEHVVLFDTSASQVGEHRDYALSVLEKFLQSLPAGDRVTLFAVDVEPLRVTKTGVTPAESLSSGMSALRNRFPAGSTDMLAGLQAALGELAGQTPGSILYIGDGMSTAHLVQFDEMQELLTSLQSRHVPVHTYAVGPNKDRQMLGILSHHTGGRAMTDDSAEAQSDFTTQARELAAASRRPVFYPTRIQLSVPTDGLLASQPFPMRADQETVYLGRGPLPEHQAVTLTGTLAGQPTTQSWTLAPAQTQGGNTFLYGFYRQAERDGGLNPLAGMEMFRAAQQSFEDEIARLEAVGEQAVATGEFDRAEQVGLKIKSVDPQNVRAEALIGAAGDLKVTLVAQNRVAQNNGNARQLPSPPADGPGDGIPEGRLLAPGNEFPPQGDDLTPREFEVPGSAIEQEEIRRTIRGQRLATEINDIVEISRRRVADDPRGVQADLESALSAVKSATDIDPDLQVQLLRRVSSALQETSSRSDMLEARQILTQKRLAEFEARQAVISAENQKELRLAQLVDRIRALMYEGFQGNPEAFEEAEAVARVIESEEPGSALGIQTVLWAEAAGQLDKVYRLRSLRADRFLAVLYQVELSHVPFPDEPPVLYPPAPVWRRLTERRKKWRSVDLHKESPNEQRIYDALEENTQLEFVDQALSDAIDFIGLQHQITIIIDEVPLADAGIPTDEPVNLIINNIKLRSAMKIMLEPLGLTWVVADEVMKITTIEEAENILQTRVYPVGDLVISPSIMLQQVMSQGGGGGIGGGGGGGIGGGGGGFGGGGGGGLGGGGGGGFFSVTDSDDNAQSKAPLKKKPVHTN